MDQLKNLLSTISLLAISLKSSATIFFAGKKRRRKLYSFLHNTVWSILLLWTVWNTVSLFFLGPYGDKEHRKKEDFKKVLKKRANPLLHDLLIYERMPKGDADGLEHDGRGFYYTAITCPDRAKIRSANGDHFEICQPNLYSHISRQTRKVFFLEREEAPIDEVFLENFQSQTAFHFDIRRVKKPVLILVFQKANVSWTGYFVDRVQVLKDQPMPAFVLYFLGADTKRVLQALDGTLTPCQLLIRLEREHTEPTASLRSIVRKLNRFPFYSVFWAREGPQPGVIRLSLIRMDCMSEHRIDPNSVKVAFWKTDKEKKI